MEAERDEARRLLEEEHRLHVAARHQAVVALRLEQQHQSHKADHNQHDHTSDQHSHCDHDHEHSGEKIIFFDCAKMKIVVYWSFFFFFVFFLYQLKSFHQ